MTTSMDTLPAHLLSLVMEEFPQSLSTACVCRAGQREPRLRCMQCGIIQEEEEEDCSTLEEDQALRSFLQTVDSLRRSTRWALPKKKRFILTSLTHLASLHPVWRPTDVYSVTDLLTLNLHRGWYVRESGGHSVIVDETMKSRKNCNGAFPRASSTCWPKSTALHIWSIFFKVNMLYCMMITCTMPSCYSCYSLSSFSYCLLLRFWIEYIK